jgi:hypothetical protein
MTNSEFTHLLASIPAFSPQQLQQLRREVDMRLASSDIPQLDLTEAEQADQELQRRLYAAGIVSEIKPPVRNMAAYMHRKAVPIQGKPLSQTIIEDRR